MRHINLTKLNSDGLSEYMVTEESNNFGDQILSLKQLVTEPENSSINSRIVTYYKIIAIIDNPENYWWDKKEMIQWMERVKKKYVKLTNCN